MNTPHQNVQYLNAARSIGNYLLREAVWDGDRCNWVDLNTDYDAHPPLVQAKSMKSDLYSGLSGVLLYLVALHELDKNELIRELIQGVVNTLMHRWDEGESKWSYFMGSLGVIYAISRASESLGNGKWSTYVRGELEKLLEEELENEEVEQLYGVAGSIGPLIEMGEYYDLPVDGFLKKIGDHILRKAIKNDDRMYWMPSICSHGLTGLSHGSSGIISCLMKLYSIFEIEEYREAAIAGLRFENDFFSEMVSNWMDLRNTSPGLTHTNEEYSMAWCNGAPGIGLSRLELWKITGDEVYHQEALRALDKTMEYVYQYLKSPLDYINFSVCHGLSGNGLILKKGGASLERPDYTRAAFDIADHGLKHFHYPVINWPGGSLDPQTSKPLSSKNLMLGASGVGWFYLSLLKDDIDFHII